MILPCSPPQPFAYEYGGADAYGRHFAKTETQDEYGVVQVSDLYLFVKTLQFDIDNL